MSFGVTCKDKFEYSGSSFSGLFANKKNFFNLKFWRMLFDICRFNRKATKLVLNQKVSAISLSEFLDSMKLGKYFKKYYLFQMASAIWSCPIEMMKNYPAQTFLRFFYNHGLLTIFNQPAWYTVEGGSKEYVKKILQKLKNEIELNCAAKKVNYDDKKNKIVLIDEKEKEHEFDQVIFACHGDEALEIIQDKIPLQQKILSKFKYSENVAVLHRDASQMPKNKKAWASWVYLSSYKERRVSVSYWMNNLQNISHDFPLFVTLNPIKEIDPNLVFGEYTYHHPIFDSEAIAAQEKLEQIQGVHNMWFCGSYTRYGFHEDGLLSAINIANKFDIRAPWQ
jgi:predicted NAD/FAD-binding protein